MHKTSTWFIYVSVCIQVRTETTATTENKNYFKLKLSVRQSRALKGWVCNQRIYLCILDQYGIYKFNSISKILLTSYVSYNASFNICNIIIMICIHRSVKRPLNFHVRCIRHNTYSEQFGRLHQAINQKVTA